MKRVQRLTLAYLGTNPKIDDNLQEEIASKFPEITINWTRLKDSIDRNGKADNNLSNNEKVQELRDIIKLSSYCRPIFWAYFEALRKNQIEPDVSNDVPIWDRTNGDAPKRKAAYKESIGYQALWPLYLQEMEQISDFDSLLEQPDELARVAKQAFINAELKYLSHQRESDLDISTSGQAKPPFKQSTNKIQMDINEAYRTLQLPDIEKVFWERRVLKQKLNQMLSATQDESERHNIKLAYETILNWQQKEVERTKKR